MQGLGQPSSPSLPAPLSTPAEVRSGSLSREEFRDVAPTKLLQGNRSKLMSRWSLPCLPSATSPEAVCGPAARRGDRAPEIQTCSAVPGQAIFQSTGAGERPAQVELVHSGTS